MNTRLHKINEGNISWSTETTTYNNQERNTGRGINEYKPDKRKKSSYLIHILTMIPKAEVMERPYPSSIGLWRFVSLLRPSLFAPLSLVSFPCGSLTRPCLQSRIMSCGSLILTGRASVWCQNVYKWHPSLSLFSLLFNEAQLKKCGLLVIVDFSARGNCLCIEFFVRNVWFLRWLPCSGTAAWRHNYLWIDIRIEGPGCYFCYHEVLCND